MNLETKNPARDFIFYPFIDLYGYDVEFLKDLRLENLASKANQSDAIICFNTAGCMKNRWDPVAAVKIYHSWQQGTYAKPPKGEAKIPKIVHQIGDVSSSVQKVVEQEPDWIYMVHKEGNKYDILKQHGGIFIDKDCDLLKPLKEHLLCHDIFAAFESENHTHGVISTKIIGAMKGCKTLDKLKTLDEQNVAISGVNIFIYPSYYFYPMSRFGDMCSDELITLSYTNYNWPTDGTKKDKEVSARSSTGASSAKPDAGDSKAVDRPVAAKESKRDTSISTSPTAPTFTPAVSTSAQETAILVKELSTLLDSRKITSMADILCGEYSWMQHVKRSDKVRYIGLDNNQNIINKNKQQWPKLEFRSANIFTDKLPNVDLIVCRDFLVFLTYEECKRAVNSFRLSGSKYLLITSFPGRRENSEVQAGGWRPLNLQVAPFSFPAPLQIIFEQCTEGNGAYVDKCLCLWSLQQIPPL